MIRRAWFRNYKVLRDVDVELERFTVLVGPNSSGKSTVLNGLEYLLTQLPSFREYPRGIDLDPALARLQSRRPRSSPAKLAGLESSPELIIAPGREVAGGPPDATAGRPTLPLPPDSISVLSLGMEVVWNEQAGQQELELLRPGAGAFMLQARLRSRWNGSAFLDQTPLRYQQFLMQPLKLSLEPAVMAVPSYSPEEKPRVESNGGQLATVLADCKLSRPEVFAAIENRLKAVVPTVERILVTRARIWPAERERSSERVENAGPVMGEHLSFDMKGAEGVPADSISEGTLLTLGLLTAIMSDPHPFKLVLLDDIDRGLHPRAIGELMKQLRALLELDPNLQILATSHSPYLLDHLEPNEICLTTLQDDGYAAVARLTEHPDFARWKDLMRPGEFWSTVGEAWIRDRDRNTASERP